jgi:hypothetical protein
MVRLVAVVVLSAMAVTVVCGCRGYGGAKESATPTASVSIPGISTLPAAATPPGTTIRQDQHAKVLFLVNDQRKSLISMAVDSAHTGSTKDLTNFIMDGQAKSSTPYYVAVTLTNVGGGRIGGAPVPLYGVNGQGTLLPAADVRGSFKKCQADRIPRHLGKGESFSTCLMFLSPRHGRLTSVEFQYASDVAPVTWVVHPRPASHTKKHSH